MEAPASHLEVFRLTDPRIKAIVFDFGGVVAEEGFVQGLKASATQAGLDPEKFFGTAKELIYASGYLTGHATEHDYWVLLRDETGIGFSDEFMRGEIMKRFILRDWMIETIVGLKHHGFRTYILSDQTDWLDVLDERYDFFKYFDEVFNSYHLGVSKRDPEIFTSIAGKLGVTPEEILFIDDGTDHIRRAAAKGLKVICFTTRESFLNELREKIGPI
jgi:FMN phosphatase YigB (HAD superfamily)